MSNKKIKALIELINSAFSNLNYPGDYNLVTHECKECYLLKATLQGKNWRDLDGQTIAANYDKLPLLTPEAFQYFLPAFLIQSLKNFDLDHPDHIVCEFTIYSLSPQRIDEQNTDGLTTRFRPFSKEQMEVIFKFLNLVLVDERFCNYYTIVERGLKRLKSIWDDSVK